MNSYAANGIKVKFIGKGNGEIVNEYLKEYEIYTIDHTVFHHIDCIGVVLKEFPSKEFDSNMFRCADQSDIDKYKLMKTNMLQIANEKGNAINIEEKYKYCVMNCHVVGDCSVINRYYFANSKLHDNDNIHLDKEGEQYVGELSKIDLDKCPASLEEAESIKSSLDNYYEVNTKILKYIPSIGWVNDDNNIPIERDIIIDMMTIISQRLGLDTNDRFMGLLKALNNL